MKGLDDRAVCIKSKVIFTPIFPTTTVYPVCQINIYLTGLLPAYFWLMLYSVFPQYPVEIHHIFFDSALFICVKLAREMKEGESRCWNTS